VLIGTPQAEAGVVEPGLTSREPNAVLEPAPEAAGQAAFNPFATVGTVVHAPAPLPPQPQGGDWSLPLAASVAGIVFIGWLMRKMVQ